MSLTLSNTATTHLFITYNYVYQYSYESILDNSQKYSHQFNRNTTTYAAIFNAIKQATNNATYAAIFTTTNKLQTTLTTQLPFEPIIQLTIHIPDNRYFAQATLAWQISSLLWSFKVCRRVEGRVAIQYQPIQIIMLAFPPCVFRLSPLSVSRFLFLLLHVTSITNSIPTFVPSPVRTQAHWIRT